MSLKFLRDVFDIWEWVLVSDSPVIDWSVVLYRMVRPVLFFDTEGTGGVWGSEWFDITLRKLFFGLFVHKFGFWGTEWVDFALKGIGGIWFEINSMVVFSP